MSIVEQRIIWLGMAIMLAYLVVYQFFFIPQFSGSEPYVGEAAIAYLGWFTVGTTFACVVLLLRDLKRRDISGKPGWFIGIVIFTWVGLPYYFFKHARRPLPNAIMNQPQGLISVLLDHTASISERDDAAMDLEEYKTPESEAALITTLLEGGAGPVVLESCIESLSKIMPGDVALEYNWEVEVEYFISNHKEQLTSRLKCL